MSPTVVKRFSKMMFSRKLLCFVRTTRVVRWKDLVAGNMSLDIRIPWIIPGFCYNVLFCSNVPDYWYDHFYVNPRVMAITLSAECSFLLVASLREMWPVKSRSRNCAESELFRLRVAWVKTRALDFVWELVLHTVVWHDKSNDDFANIRSSLCRPSFPLRWRSRSTAT